ncbi:SUN domain-containing protein 2-like [Salminus brasiliensis]|uniref:SUN domain-containing protein 2-like n=1 Tax=Salminus brasiliensis TaxID=930266 RepID=UPI003B836037
MPQTEAEQGEMSRRSARLATSPYYAHDDDAASTSSTESNGHFTYRESPVRVFKRKTGGRKAGGSSRASSRASSHAGSVSELQSPYAREALKSNSATGSGSVPRGPSQKVGVPMRPQSRTVTPLTSSTSTVLEKPDFSSGYSSSEDNNNSLPISSGGSSHSVDEAGFGLRDVLTSPGRALAMLYWWMGTAWYSLTSGMSLINVSLLSRRTAHVRKAILLLLLLLLLVFGLWYFYPSLKARLYRSAPRSTMAPPTHTHASVPPPVRPPVDDSLARAGLSALRNEIYADLQEREAKWTESRAREMDNVLREIQLLKQDEEKQKRTQEMLQADLQDLRVRVGGAAHSEHNSVMKEELSGIKRQISDLRSDVSGLRSSSELLAHRLDVQEAQNAKLKAELSDWLLQQLAGSVGSEQGVVMHADLQRALEALEKKIMDRLGEERERETRDVWRTVGETLQEEGAGAVTVKDVERIVQRALSLHRADGVGMADYALESSGASVINTRCSETYHTRTACLSLFGIPLWYQSESPRTVTQPELYPGKCWAFRGSQGFLVISLSYPVRITHVSLEHVPRVLSPTGRIDSAPKDFAVYGMADEDAEGKLLGTFTYDHDGEPIQTFRLPDLQSEVYQLVELRILSNWGHPEYTCIYRFRVHGQP